MSGVTTSFKLVFVARGKPKVCHKQVFCIFTLVFFGIVPREDQKLSPRPSYVTHDLAADFPAPPNRVMHDMVREDLDGFLKARWCAV